MEKDEFYEWINNVVADDRDSFRQYIERISPRSNKLKLDRKIWSKIS